jgi:hypothetical protein
VNVDLSPGEWAGVLNAVMQESRRLQRLTDEYETDFREDAEDLARIGRLIREAIAEDGRELPEVPPGTPGTNASCPSCGERLYARVNEVNFYSYAEWRAGGSVVIGGWNATDNGNERDVLACPDGCGDFALPNVDDYR